MTNIEIKKALPHGFCKVIAERAGVQRRAVSLFMKGKTNSYKIRKASLEVLGELAIEKKELMDKINN
jgi:hypothetical protein